MSKSKREPPHFARWLIKATFFRKKSKYYGQQSVITCIFFNGGLSRDPYLNSGILFMPIMSALLAIYMDLMKTLRVGKQRYGLYDL